MMSSTRYTFPAKSTHERIHTLKNTVKDLAVHTRGYAFSNVDFTDQFSGKQLECTRLIQRTY